MCSRARQALRIVPLSALFLAGNAAVAAAQEGSGGLMSLQVNLMFWTLLIFIVPPSLEDLFQRLRSRATETADVGERDAGEREDQGESVRRSLAVTDMAHRL